jgi:uncharacterized SAM-binding protein YcdF (DUF218 family)
VNAGKHSVAKFASWGFRGAAFCFGIFVAINALVAWRDAGVDSNLWWIDLRVLPAPVRWISECAMAGVLVQFGLKPRFGRAFRMFGLVVTGSFALWVVRDTLVVLLLMSEGRLPAWNVPLSVFVLFCLVLLGVVIAKGDSASSSTSREGPQLLFVATGFSTGAGIFLALVPIGVMATFGRTDYRIASSQGEQNLAVVLGAGVQRDGTPSLALSDRTMTGVDLYKEGVASMLFLSGGPGPGATHETQAMRKLALDAGVPASDIFLDPEGVSTWATARNTSKYVEARTKAPSKIFAVSHGYHLPRVELAFQSYGLDVLTVPATETRPLARRHYYALREVAGFWAYWARRLIAS